MEIEFEISYRGAKADQSQLDMYDAARAFLGFQRSIALTTHFVINGEIITQATALKKAKIFSTPPQDGSWKINSKIVVLGTAIYATSIAPQDTVLGHLVYSAYDYVIKNTIGIHVDYEKSLLQLYEKYKLEEEAKNITKSKIDSLTEKCESSIIEIHRPMVKSKTATKAEIYQKYKKRKKPIGRTLNSETYARIIEDIRSDKPEVIKGYISSYNINTYKGRIYIIGEDRPIPFILDESARNPHNIRKITESLQINSTNKFSENSIIKFIAFKIFGISGRIKNIHVIDVE